MDSTPRGFGKSNKKYKYRCDLHFYPDQIYAVYVSLYPDYYPQYYNTMYIHQPSDHNFDKKGNKDQ